MAHGARALPAADAGPSGNRSRPRPARNWLVRPSRHSPGRRPTLRPSLRLPSPQPRRRGGQPASGALGGICVRRGIGSPRAGQSARCLRTGRRRRRRLRAGAAHPATIDQESPGRAGVQRHRAAERHGQRGSSKCGAASSACGVVHARVHGWCPCKRYGGLPRVAARVNAPSTHRTGGCLAIRQTCLRSASIVRPPGLSGNAHRLSLRNRWPGTSWSRSQSIFDGLRCLPQGHGKSPPEA